MNSFLFLAGRIRAKESELLTMAQAERMIGSDSVESAFRVLTELPYAEFFDKETHVSDFLEIINQGLIETKELLLAGTDNHPALDFVWKDFDINNLKRALKEKLIEGAETIGEFSESNGYAPFGSLTMTDINEIIFGIKESEEPIEFPAIYLETIAKVEELYSEAKNFQPVEFLLDQAHFLYLKSLAKKLKNSFLNKYIQILADESNSKSILRFILTQTDISADAFVPFGSFNAQDVIKAEVTDLDAFLDFLLDTKLVYLVDACRDYRKKEGDEYFLSFYERLLDKQKLNFLINEEAGEIETIQIPMVYFMRRVQNSRVLKFIMFAKMYGLPAEQIYGSLKNLFHFEA
jgi:vacuolar-type H+-ATPase subunit C/Vma6